MSKHDPSHTHSTATAPVAILTPGGQAGKSVIALGVVDLLARHLPRVGVFRPIVEADPGDDKLLDLLLAHDGVDLEAEVCGGVTYDEVHHNPDAALTTIVERFGAVQDRCDTVVIIGSDYSDVTAPAEFSFNARIAANLGAGVLLLVSAKNRTPDQVARVVAAAADELTAEHAQVIATFANRCAPDAVERTQSALDDVTTPSWVIPESPQLAAPLIGDVVAALDGEVLNAEEISIDRAVEGLVLCDGSVEHVIGGLAEGRLCLTPGDRPGMLVALAAAHRSDLPPHLAGIVLTGGHRPSPDIEALVASLDGLLPVVATSHDSVDAFGIAAATRPRLGRNTPARMATALGQFEQHVDTAALLECIEVTESTVVTPLMFESALLEGARADRRHIVLPEANDERVLRAAATVLARGIAAITLLGDRAATLKTATALGLNLEQAEFIDPNNSDLVERFAAEFAHIRADKGMTLDGARDVVRDVSYFGTMMVQEGLADAMVSGAAHSTAHTITPAFQVIKTAPGIDTASSVFFMCLADRVLVYGDCAVVPDPNVDQLADIALSSASTSARFGIEPRVAMLSYSTGESGSGSDVDKVRAATEQVRERQPDLVVDGPLQYDAAVDAGVAEKKLPGSELGGRATVFIFPDLNTGNNTYKAVQRSAGAVAIGPILQGLNKPVNDLSRGATVRDIVNTIAATAIQAGYAGDGAGSEQ